MTHRILIVDDEDMAVELYIRFLRDGELSGVQSNVRSCRTIAEMEELLSEYEFDVIILDLNLVGSSTSDQTVQYIEENHNRLPPIIVLTGRPDLEMRHRCIMAGADDYILKTTAAKEMILAERVHNAILRRSRTAMPA